MAHAKLLRLLTAVLAAVAILLLLAAAIPFGWLTPAIEARLSRRFGTPVTIASIRRLDSISLQPRIVIGGLRMPQPRWAGAGDLATARTVFLRMPVLPLLIGRFRPSMAHIDGLRLALVRANDGRANLTASGGNVVGHLPPDLVISDGRITYRDAMRDRQADVALRVDSRHGVAVDGTGAVRGRPVRLSFRGAAPSTVNAAWPFRASIDGPTLTMRANGTTDHPLDPRAMSLALAVRADSLMTWGAIMEAGLFDSQPVRLAAHVRHDGLEWRITRLHGTIGRSQVAGDGIVLKRGGRTHLEGSIHSASFNLGDLSSDKLHATAAAREKRIGKRLVPQTKIDLTKLGRTDGVLRFDIDRLFGRGSPPIRSLSGVMTLDHRLLTAAPLRVGLARGDATGTIIVDHRDRPLPLLKVGLRVTETDLATLAGGGPVVGGSAWGRLRLSGSGRKTQDAIGRSSGIVSLAARNGTLPAPLASLLGLDAGRAVTTDKDRRSALRCGELAVSFHSGLGHIDRLLVDTSRSQTHGTGTITLPTERLAIALRGAPKKDSVLRLDGAIGIEGTIEAPRPKLPSRSAGTILKAIGNGIIGHQSPLAQNADCNRL